MSLYNRSICFVLAGLTLYTFAAAARAQDDDAGEKKVGEKRAVFNTKSANYQEKHKFLYTAAKAYNDQASQAKDEREKWLQRYKIYENVVSLRSKDGKLLSKDAMMAYIDQARKELGVSELEGYQRIGKYNPYTGESYIRYYDPKTGELVMAEVRATHKELEKAVEDFEKTRDRLRASRERVMKAYQDAQDAYKQAVAAKKELDTAIAAATPRPSTPTPPADINLAGTTWEIDSNGNIFGLRILEFGDSGKVTFRSNVEASRSEGTWKQSGDTVELTYPSGNTYKASVSGNQITVHLKNGPVTLYRK